MSTDHTMDPTDLSEEEGIVSRGVKAGRTWSRTTLEERSRVIRAIARALDADRRALIDLAVEETGLTDTRLSGELTRTVFQLNLFADTVAEGAFLGVRIDEEDAAWPMGAPRPDLRRVMMPIGPVVVFAAGNFPFAFSVAGGDTAAALAAGNPVILKAHPGHLRLSHATGDVVRAAAASAGAPSDILQIVVGRTAGVAVLQHPDIRAASFTGSIRGGRALFDIAQGRPDPIPFYGELGSCNPVFVLDGAATSRAQDIASGFLASLTGSQGQLCTKPGLLFVPVGATVAAEITESLLPGPSRLLSDRIDDGYRHELTRMLERHDVTVLAGANVAVSSPAPTVLRTSISSLIEDPDAFITEIFGPAGLVVEYSSVDELLSVGQLLPGQLTATIMGAEDDLPQALPLALVLAQKAGRVLWNQWPTGVSVTYAQNHGGPYPASTAPQATSVGTASIERFLRPVAFQNMPDALLPAALRRSNPLGVPRQLNGAGEK